MSDGYFENVKCWLCSGQSWINGTICHECNPKAERDYSAILMQPKYLERPMPESTND